MPLTSNLYVGKITKGVEFLDVHIGNYGVLEIKGSKRLFAYGVPYDFVTGYLQRACFERSKVSFRFVNGLPVDGVFEFAPIEKRELEGILRLARVPLTLEDFTSV